MVSGQDDWSTYISTFRVRRVVAGFVSSESHLPCMTVIPAYPQFTTCLTKETVVQMRGLYIQLFLSCKKKYKIFLIL